MKNEEECPIDHIIKTGKITLSQSRSTLKIYDNQGFIGMVRVANVLAVISGELKFSSLIRYENFSGFSEHKQLQTNFEFPKADPEKIMS